MLGKILLIAFSVATLAHSEHCWSNISTNAIKVRISLKTALGSEAYAWNANEEYLFKSMIAFALRSVEKQSEYQASDVLICNNTERVSFTFMVKTQDGSIVQSSEIELAVKKNRNRINGAFLLNDNTLEFVEIPPTLSPTTGSSSSTWLIVFGVVLSLAVFGIIFLIVSGIQQRRRKNRQLSERTEDYEVRMETAMTMENGILYEIPYDTKGSQTNGAYVHDKDTLTSL
ncbi:collectrin [Microcaecilia unicolor]|uniref:Collectrin n=1 Tax=Microcaecilia unicolor TaxID=1415580 RepID=A0A6P7XYL0_9AMPH|nr:collectrin [Microcaecilia unicolor]